MNHGGDGKGGGSEGENSEKEPIALDADNENMAQERRVGPISRDYISLEGRDRTSSAAAHGGWSTNVGGPATTPLIVEDATVESATDGTVRIPGPVPHIGLGVL